MTEHLPEPAKTSQASGLMENQILQDSLLAEYVAVTGPHPLQPVLRWTRDLGWLTWSGKVWQLAPEPVAIEVIRQSLKAIFVHAVSAPTANQKTADIFKPLLSKNKASAVAFFIKGLLAIDSAVFDADPDLLNVQNGVVDLRTGNLKAHRSEYLMTKITSVDWNPGSHHDDWQKALLALPEDTREYMQVRYGQSATGHPVDDDVLVIQSGGGQNGKSTLVNAISKALGDYGITVPEKVLLANPGDHPTELMTLRGARLAIIEELPEGHRLPVKRLKDTIGTPTITARAMRQDNVTWDATHSLFVNTNYIPQVSETDHGTWRRLQLVHFPYKFVDPHDPLMAPNDRHGVPGLRDRIRDNTDNQLEAVLAWVVAGARAWYANGRAQLAVPLSIQADTQSWRAEADLILAYAQERLIFDPESKTPTKELFEDFTDWLRDAGRQTWNDQTFGSRFGGHDLAIRNHVEKSRINVYDGTPLSRRFYSSTPLSGKLSVWSGVKFNH